MLKETVKIIVTRSNDNRRFETLEDIETDGSFYEVERAVARLINAAWPIGTVLTSSWQYV